MNLYLQVASNVTETYFTWIVKKKYLSEFGAYCKSRLSLNFVVVLTYKIIFEFDYNTISSYQKFKLNFIKCIVAKIKILLLLWLEANITDASEKNISMQEYLHTKILTHCI